MKISNKREFQQIAVNHSSDTDFKDFMKISKKCAAKPYFFLVNDATLQSYDPLRFRKILLTIDERLGMKKLQHDINRDVAKILTLSSGKIYIYCVYRHIIYILYINNIYIYIYIYIYILQVKNITF